MTMTCHELHPEDRIAMDILRTFLATQPSIEFAPQARPIFDALIAQTPAAPGVRYEPATLGGEKGWWCRPEHSIEGAAILYLHGGAYVLGSAEAYRNFVGHIAQGTGVATFIVDYGLAPEFPFPNGYYDALTAYQVLSDSGYTRLALAGDSAGGGLALALLADIAIASQDGSISTPSAAAVMSPWTDLALTGDSIVGKANVDPLLTRDGLDRAATLYLKEHERHTPWASPLYANLKGLPPVILHVGEDEILLDDSRRYAEKIEARGGFVQLHIWQGMVHVFPSNLELRAAKEAVECTTSFLQIHLQGQETARTEPHNQPAGIQV